MKKLLIMFVLVSFMTSVGHICILTSGTLRL